MAESETLRVLYQGIHNGTKFYVTAREDSHVLGQKFQVELRYQCQPQVQQDPTDVTKIPVQDSFSVCDLAPDSVTINTSRTAVALKTKMANREHYYEQISDGQANPQLLCEARTEIKTFSLTKICR